MPAKPVRRPYKRTPHKTDKVKVPEISLFQDRSPSAPKQVTTLTLADIPPSDVLLDLGVDPLDTGQFLQALQFVVAQTAGQNIKQASSNAGIHPSVLYTPKWQTLIGQARRLALGNALLSVQAVKVAVFDEWPSLVDKLIFTAKHAAKDSDSNNAIELLHLMFIKDAGEIPDASSAQKYLRERPNFAPQSPLNMIVEAGAQVTINQTQAPTSDDGDYIDVEATEIEDDPPPPQPPAQPLFLSETSAE